MFDIHEKLPPAHPSSAAHRAVGEYQLVAQIGRGGMADVFLAVPRSDSVPKGEVVIKQLRPEVFEDDDFRAMFVDEARIALRMSHPNVVRTLDVGKDGDCCF